MRSVDMEKVQEIAYDEETVFNNMLQYIELKGKRVLEIGGNLHEPLVRNSGVIEWVSLDPRKENYISSDGVYKCYKMNLLDFELKEKYYDFAFSSNALEHVNNLKQCFTYIYDSLKVGGEFFAHFGPIWSAPDGHHLEDINLKDGSVINFWEANFIPKWYHLLYAKGDLKEILIEKFAEEDADRIVNYIYESTYLNRLFFKDYINIFLNSKFRIKRLSTTSLIDYKLQNKILNRYTDSEIHKLLCEMYGNDDYDCRDIMVLLKRAF